MAAEPAAEPEPEPAAASPSAQPWTQELAALGRLRDASKISAAEFAQFKAAVLRRAGVGGVLEQAAAREQGARAELDALRAKEGARREAALALARRTQAEVDRGAAPLAEVSGWLDDWCANFDAITIGRCAHCEMGTNFGRVATMARQAKGRVLAAVGALEAARAERLRLEAALADLQGMVEEQDDIVRDEQEGRVIIARSMRESFAELAEAQSEASALVAPSPLPLSPFSAPTLALASPRPRCPPDPRPGGGAQRATAAAQKAELEAAAKRELALQTALTRAQDAADASEAKRAEQVRALEDRLATATAELGRQTSIVEAAEKKAEAELDVLAQSRLALADRGFVSDESEGERADEAEERADEADDHAGEGPSSFAATTFAAQAEGKAIELAEQQRRAKRERKAERRRRREERQQRAERQPGTYM